jgi:hypothetical protein
VKRALLVIALAAWTARPAHAECRCVSIAADVAAQFQADAIKADGLYARGDFSAALAIYARAWTASKDGAFLYAVAMSDWQLGKVDDARAAFQQYLALGGELAFADRARGALGDLKGSVGAAVGGTLDTAAGAASFVGGSAVGAGGEISADLHASADKPKKLAGGAAVVVGVVALAAVAVVGIQSIRAGLSDNVDIDPKLDLSLGASAVVMGGTALYLSSLTATAGAAGSLHCMASPVVYPGGGGVAAMTVF